MSYDQADAASDEDERDWSEWDDADEEATKSLFSDHVLPSAIQAIVYDAREHGFDLRHFRSQNKVSDYDTIRCINYIRTEVAAGRLPVEALNDQTSSERPWQKDQYMHPALPDDPLLFHDFDDEADLEVDQARPSSSAADHGTAATIQNLQDENMALRNTLQQMSLLALPSELTSGQLEDGNDSDWRSKWQRTAGTYWAQAEPNELATSRPDVNRSTRDATEQINEAYFDSYGFFGIHREMISDKIRTEAYRDALQQNPLLIKGASLLDVGCGTGILSMFAAQGGATQVIGVDGSERIADVAKRLVSANKLAADQGGAISVVQGRLEQLDKLPADKVDVIVSEWMGYALLFESMLDTVLYARDSTQGCPLHLNRGLRANNPDTAVAGNESHWQQWLKPGGAILPDLASLHMAAAGQGATGLTFWNKVYGFDYSLVQQELREDAHQTALLKDVSAQDMLSNSCQLRQLDIAHMTTADASFSTDFVLEPSPESCSGPQECHAFVLWFDTDFSARFCKEHAVKLSTSPYTPQTHWCQTVLVLRKPILFGPSKDMAANKVATAIKGRFSMARSDQHRGIDMSVEYMAEYSNGSCGHKDVQIFSMTMSS